MKKHIALLAILMATSCTHSTQTYESYLSKRGLNVPTEDTIQHCRGYGCHYIDEIELTQKQWASIDKIFKPRAKTPQSERKKITTAIGHMENIIGRTTGTDEDIKGTFKKTGPYQLDCVDESTNTTLYLAALQNRNLLKFHTTQSPDTRLPLIHAGRWPHQTAVIAEKESQTRYAVDSWFHNNGIPPEIIPHTEWKKGWKPTKDPDDAD